MDKQQIFQYLRSVALNYPASQEYYIHDLMGHFEIQSGDKDYVRARDYIREFMLELTPRIAGGVVYPQLVKMNYDKPDRIGMSSIWRKLIFKCYKHGIVFGDRIILPNVYVSGMDMRLGKYHYRDVGYTASNIVKTWNKYFNDRAVLNFADEMDRRVGYSCIYRCADHIKPGSKHIPCLDSVAIIMTSANSAAVHANYRISNLNRMTLMDFYLLHRFLRMIFPLKALPKISISCHFNTLSLDTLMLGWLVNVKGMGKYIEKYRREKTGYKRMEMAMDFADSGGHNDDETQDMFENRDYGLEELRGKKLNTKVNFYSGQ